MIKGAKISGYFNCQDLNVSTNCIGYIEIKELDLIHNLAIINWNMEYPNGNHISSYSNRTIKYHEGLPDRLTIIEDVIKIIEKYRMGREKIYSDIKILNYITE
jgi:hypothetical protein